jgi:hypothetical protein
MQRLEVSAAVWHIYGSLGVKGLKGLIRSGVHILRNCCSRISALSGIVFLPRNTSYSLLTLTCHFHNFVPSYVTTLVTVYAEGETDRQRKQTIAFVTHTAIWRRHYNDRTVTNGGVIAVHSDSLMQLINKLCTQNTVFQRQSRLPVRL